MSENGYYKITPKDNDPEVANVLDLITNSAKRRFDYGALENAFIQISDSDFFLSHTLVVLSSKQDKLHFIDQTM